MSKKWLALAALLSTQAVFAGKFTYEFNKKLSARIRLVRPPLVLLTGRTLALRQRGEIRQPELQGIGLSIEQAMVGEFTPAQPNQRADLALTFTVVGYTPVTARNYTQNETRYVQTGTKAGKDIFGKPSQNPVYDNKSVPVEYMEARGGLSLEVVVTDATGSIADSFSPSKNYVYKIVVAENGQSKVGRGTLPTRESLIGEMVGEVVQQIAARYTKTYQEAAVPLAVDEELRAGDAFAVAGNWKSALDSWKATSMRHNAADQLYNVALGLEATAFAAYDESHNLADAEPLFQQAVQNYQQAIQQDPGEKYFREAAAQLSESEAVFARAKEQYKSHQAEMLELIRRRHEAGPPPAEAATRSAEADSPNQAAFRNMIRIRLKSATTQPATAARQDWSSMGARIYKLDPQDARQIVDQECSRLEERQANLKDYRSMFSDLAGDHVITAEERDQLVQLAKRLELSSDDTQQIESQFQFKETSSRGANARR